MESDQYSKRKSIRIFCLKQEDSEHCGKMVTKFIETKLSKKLSPEDNITVAHGLSSSNSPMAILGRFTRADLKMEVLSRRNILKDSDVSFPEVL